ncbi:MAG TPA: protein translocase subunit SecF, partial [Phycisphaerales bacterium]|nr:protein translocase subunit SecF [Phycisphaerales bacterium]
LCYDTPGMRLTQAEGNWQVAGAGRTIDEIGKPAVRFDMDALGAAKLGELTGSNVGRQMAVLLDDQVYTAPNLQSRISGQGRITGVEPSEIDYIVRVLGAGSMAAKLSPEPVSESTVGPELGADNLDRGLKAGVIAFALVAAFMVVYYFGCGLIAVLALLINAVLILGLMAINHAAFSLPGIAGVVLTFGMAVDANVLIYERMREEMESGADFRTAVRLGYSRAMASIVDGNTTVFIVSVVLAFFGTQEIKGFAITMIVGSITTFFTQLYVTRVLFYLLVEKLGWRRGSMLAVKFPAIARAFNPNIDWMKYRYPMLGFSALMVVLSGAAMYNAGADLFDNDFRGGTKITVQLKNGPDGQPMMMTRQQAQDRVEAQDIDAPKVLAINPSPEDATKSSRFAVKTTDKDAVEVQQKVLAAFSDVVDVQPAIKFTGMDADALSAPVKPILSDNLADTVGPAALRVSSADYRGGAAIIVENMDPRPTKAQLEERLRQIRSDPAHEPTRSRPHSWVVLAGDDNAVQSAALLVYDENADFIREPDRWTSTLRTQEWAMLKDAMARSTSLAGVESFSAAIAQSFAAQAAISVVFSTLLIIIYIWLRFQSFRYSFGAILSTLHDCIVAVGLIALCEPLVNNAEGVANAIGVGPFKIDLNVVAAVLTILGYSLNDTVIVMDRIRETKGKLPFATRKVVNDAINSTISRTVITSGLTMLATMTLYIFGGEAIRPFAFTFMVGVITGTYSSIFIAAPLVWVHKEDPTQHPSSRARAAVATV